MKTTLAYVQAVLDNEIVIFCNDRVKCKYLRSIGAKRKFIFSSKWMIRYINENDLSKFFINLRDGDFLFSYDQHGLGPSDLFRYLREKNLLQGHFTEIYWTGGGKYRTHKD